MTDQTDRRAALTVADRAHDAEDLKLLLDVLGLVDALTTRRELPREESRHGTQRTYTKGCRCDDCRAANSERCRTRRYRSKNDPTRADRAGHGKQNTYKNHACRCQACCAAHSAAMAPYLRQYRAAKAKAAA